MLFAHVFGKRIAAGLVYLTQKTKEEVETVQVSIQSFHISQRFNRRSTKKDLALSY